MKIFLSIIIINILCCIQILNASKFDSLYRAVESETDDKKIEFIDSLLDKQNDLSIYDKINFSKEALEIIKSKNYPEKDYKYLLLLAKTYLQIGDNSKSLRYILEALEVAKELDDDTKIASTQSNIGIMYAKQNQLDKAMNYFQKAEELFLKLDSSHYLSGIYNNIALIYNFRNDTPKVMEYLNKSLDLLPKHKDSVYTLNTILNMAEIYKTNGNYINAKKYLQMGKDFCFSCRNTMMSLRFSVIEASILITENKNQKALNILKRSRIIAKEKNYSKLLITINTYLSDIYEEKGDFENSYVILKEIKKLEDSIEASDSGDNLAELLNHYEMQDKSRQNQMLEQENKIQSMYIQLLVLVILFGLSIGILLFWKYKTKRKDNILLKEKTDQLEYAYEKLNDQNKLISDQKEELVFINEELKNRSQKLKESNEAKDKLFSIIAHDLRNPLNALVLATDMLVKDSYDIDKENLDLIYNQLNKSVYRLSELLENLLDWARSQTGRIEYSPKHIDINNLILRNIDLFKNNVVEKNIDLQYLPTEDISVYADINMTDTIVRNIISNAVKFTVPNGKICIKLESAEKNIVLKVIDNGIGIDRVMIDKILDDYQYFTTSGTKSEKGTGLGLKIVKEFIEMNKGELFIKSIPDGGTSIEITLPADKDSEESF